MNRIFCATPVYCFGEILWDILPDGPQPGGAPLNVAYHLSKLKIPTGLISRIGKDPEGKKLEDLMDNWGIEKLLLQSDPAHTTGQVLAKITAENEVDYEIKFPAAWDFIEANSNAVEKVKGSDYFIYGSLAARNAPSRNALFELLDHAKFKVFDINLRPPFFTRDLLEILLEKADLLKMNKSELEIVLGMLGCNFNNEVEQISFIKEKFNIQEIIITKGEHGASYYTRDEVYHRGGVTTKVCDTIGSGDSFLAAFIAHHFLKEPADIILKKAVAMGSFISGKMGGCPPYQLSEYMDIIKRIS